MINNVEEHKILDNSKLKAYMTCPRRYFFEYILGWRPEHTSHDLWFGQAVHLGLEHMYDIWRERGPEFGYSRLVQEAYHKFLEHYRKEFGVLTDIDHPEKNPANVLELFYRYAQKYGEEDKFEVIHTEISGSIPINREDEPKLIFFRLDTVIEDKGKRKILEHKTSKWSVSLWEQSWDKDFQPIIGSIVMYMLYDNPGGIIMNGLFLRKDPSKIEFYRKHMNPSLRQLEAGRANLELWYDQIFGDHARLHECKEEDHALRAFPCNPKGCMAYNRPCTYKDYCEAWPNPLRYAETPPPGFCIEHWDPRAQDKETTTKVTVE